MAQAIFVLVDWLDQSFFIFIIIYYNLTWRCFVIKNKKDSAQINEEIRDKEVRLIDSDGEMIGVVPIKEAQSKAEEKDLDLVKIAANATPPVCRIMDYGKYMFEQSKKDKEIRKNQKITNIKEVRLSASIETHDFNFKVKRAITFLKSGDKLKVSMRFKGREMNYTSIGVEVLNKFAEAIEEVGVVERKPKLEGRQMIMIVNPKQ